MVTDRGQFDEPDDVEQKTPQGQPQVSAATVSTRLLKIIEDRQESKATPERRREFLALLEREFGTPCRRYVEMEDYLYTALTLWTLQFDPSIGG